MQIGYHDTLDDSVNTIWLEHDKADRHLKGLITDPRADSVWIRATSTGTAFYIKKNGKVLE